ncbi:MAG: hypothetical protein O2820_21485 [Planctomycetota bacterium]|nr:hypothetical protein [Planctomycetota bacterium]MDA1251790.1 hypothetical protein [Planctomycetota bacterium]
MLFKFQTLPVYCLALLTTVLIGCGDPDGDVSEVQTADVDAAHAEAAASGHHHDAPHGGHLIPLGDHEYNIELVFSAEPRELHAYVLGGHAEKAIALELESFDFDQEDEEGNEVEIVLTANPQEGDKEGTASRYTAKGDAIPASIKDLEDLHGHVHIGIDGKQYTGDLHHDEDGEGHHDKGNHEEVGDKGHKDGDQDVGHKKDGDKAAAPAEKPAAVEKPATDEK